MIRSCDSIVIGGHDFLGRGLVVVGDERLQFTGGLVLVFWANLALMLPCIFQVHPQTQLLDVFELRVCFIQSFVHSNFKLLLKSSQLLPQLLAWPPLPNHQRPQTLCFYSDRFRCVFCGVYSSNSCFEFGDFISYLYCHACLDDCWLFCSGDNADF